MGDDREFYHASNPVHRAPALLQFATYVFGAAAVALFIASARYEDVRFGLAMGGGAACLGVFFLLARESRRRGLRKMALTERAVLARRELVEAKISEPTRRAAFVPVVLGLILLVPSVIGLPFAVAGVIPGFRPPPRVSLEDALPGHWVRVDRAELDCGTRLARGDYVYFLGRSEGGTAFVASFKPPARCEEASLSGVVEPLHPNLARTLGGWIPEQVHTSLCTWCGPENSQMALLLAVIGLVAGGLLLRAGRREYRQARR